MRRYHANIESRYEVRFCFLISRVLKIPTVLFLSYTVIDIHGVSVWRILSARIGKAIFVSFFFYIKQHQMYKSYYTKVDRFFFFSTSLFPVSNYNIIYYIIFTAHLCNLFSRSDTEYVRFHFAIPSSCCSEDEIKWKKNAHTLKLCFP